MSNNSSRSSLVSAGSSYHSWEEENGFSAGFISTLNQTDAAWHDVSSKPTADEPEKILQQFTGLSKGDLLVIQTKLLDAAQTRAKNTEVRSPSTLRRRRPSTAQSIQSYGGIPSRVSLSMIFFCVRSLNTICTDYKSRSPNCKPVYVSAPLRQLSQSERAAQFCT